MAQSIPLIYRLFFLYIDPLICLSGVYLAFFDPATYIANGVPSFVSSSISGTELSPLSAYFLRSLGSWSLSILALQLLILHQFKDVKLWKILQFSILVLVWYG